MTAAHDYEEMHHLVDLLPPAGVRRLRLLVESDPELARFVDAAEDEIDGRDLSFIGLGSSGRSDVSERHDEILREGLDRLL
ncbi:hypothetical protein N5079_09555 [Planotetraspora sp. A-T 1434]|uniref:hypothetical protein n=1 Tax=Planotetraspora sp. A-T 1434 TaxID=2979219 RepID=UPI0021C0C6C8|nr:hypothetical protein [Planotetraspora sp. A-T 1434]MCT9930461.1 hypothetical protein [Planotetraspora sp. A-T 1434]